MKFQLQPMNVKLMQSEEAAQLGLFKFSPCLSLRSIKYERRRPKCFREVLTTRAIALIYLYTKFECCLEFEKYQHECWFISKFGKYQKKILFLSQILVVCLKHNIDTEMSFSPTEMNTSVTYQTTVSKQ